MKVYKQTIKQCGALFVTTTFLTTFLMSAVYADSALPGSFPTTNIFMGAYKNIRETKIYFPTGNWHLIANGRVYSFVVEDIAGKLIAKSNMGKINISWNRDLGKIIFTRLIEMKDPSRTLRQTFTGYLMTYSDGTQAKDSKRDYKWRMAGTFHHETPKMAKDIPTSSSWYATLPR